MKRRPLIGAAVLGRIAGCTTGSVLSSGGILGGFFARPTAARAQSAVPPDVIASLAPTGTLRVAINYGNAALAVRDPATGKLSGVSVELAAELMRRLGIPIILVPFDAAGKVSAAAAQNVWDVAFLARDPERAKETSFTPAYVVIHGNYVVPKTSPITTLAQVDQDGVRVAVSSHSAYDLYLSRTLEKAKLVHGANNPETIDMFRSQKLDAIAGVQEALRQLVAGDPSLRMIGEPFMEIDQAMGTPAGRAPGSAYLASFVESVKADGFVKQALVRSGQADAEVAPPAASS